MTFVDTTNNLVKLAVAHLIALGYTNVDVEDNDDIGGKYVEPRPTDPGRRWCLSLAGTDCKYVDESGIDAIFIRPKAAGGDEAITLRDFDHLDLLLVKEGYLRPIQ